MPRPTRFFVLRAPRPGFRFVSVKSSIVIPAGKAYLATHSRKRPTLCVLGDFKEMLYLEDHAAHAIVGGELDDRAHPAETESDHGRLLVFCETDRTFLQLDTQRWVLALLAHTDSLP